MDAAPPLLPLLRDQRKVDESHLKLLAIFHFVGAGLAILGMLFLALHYALMHTVFMNPEMWQPKNQTHPPPMPPQEIFAIFKWFYLAGAVWFAASLALNLASAVALLKRKWRTFSLVVAGINCIHMPLGTVLGVFTIIVLIRDSVVEAYEAAQTSG